jgi:hypothetical protein
MPQGEWPHSFSAIQALGLVFSQVEYSSRRHWAQLPQAMGNATTTRSPTLSPRTPGPVSTTSPMNSCPMMSPGTMAGM